MMDDAIRRINIHVGERSWYRYGFYGSLVDYRLKMPYFILSSFEFSN